MKGITKQFQVCSRTTTSTSRSGRARSTPWWGRTAPGKTTLMNVLYGLVHADSGEILIDGKPPTSRRA